MSASVSSIRVIPAAGATPQGVGNYRYIAWIAEGGMADVYLAVTKAAGAFEKLVVIKQLREELTADQSFVTMFTDEARLAARLNHPNVVQTYEVGSDAGRHFIAMEFLEGVPYVRLLRLKDRISAPLAFHVRILCDVLNGLHYAHELLDFDGKPLAVVHRDVSPQNVMLTFAGGVKVLDFGIAKASLAAEQRPDDFKGKLEYMSPEQALLEDIDRRGDVFSVGIMLWEAITRRRLYQKGDDKFARLVAGELPDALEIRPDAPRKLAKICARALARDRSLRYPTALDMALDLEEWLSGTTQHIGQRDLGGYIAEKFASTRAKLTEAVEGQLKLFHELPENSPNTLPLSRITTGTDVPPADQSEPPPMAIPPAAPTGMTAPAAWSSEAPPPALSSAPILVPAPAPAPSASFLPAPVAPVAPVVPVAPPAPAKSTGPALIAVAAVMLAVMLVGGVLYARARGHAKNEPVTSATVSTGAAPQGGLQQAPVAATAVDIDYTIKASPPGARIFVDGNPQPSNPALGRFPRDGAMHVVRVEAPGHEPKEEQLAFDRSFLLTLELKPITAAPETSGTTTSKPVWRGGRGPRGPKGNSAIDTENPY